MEGGRLTEGKSLNRRSQRIQARVLVAVLTLGVCLWVTPTRAQQNTSVLTGTVVDANNKQPVADVVVTATSPNLQGEQLAVTDATGLYRIPQLPPGVYTLRFEKETFQPYSRSDIALRLNSTDLVNAYENVGNHLYRLHEALASEVEQDALAV